MTWRERQQFQEKDYQRASFKGVEFWVETYNFDGGRRQSIQKFPGDEYTNVQDLGRDSSQLTINAFLIGDEYDNELRLLEGTLLEGGAGELRLPWRTPLQVTVVGRIRIDEAKGERGFCSVSFDCIETAAPPPVFSKDTAARVRENAADARAITQERFTDRFDVANLSEQSEGRKAIRSGMNTGAQKIVDAQNRVSAFIAEIPKGANTVNRLAGALNDLINTPLDLSDEIVNAVITMYSALRSTAATAQNVVETWGKGGPIRILKEQTFNFSDTFVPPTINTNNQQGVQGQRAIDAWYSLLRLNIFYEFADLITRLPFESRQQALTLRTEYIETMDSLLAELEGLEYEALYSLNESVGSFLEEAAETLPNVATYSPPQTIPALVAAQTLYGDARRADDIVLRNNVQHPGFLGADEPLEVLVV